MTSMMDVDGIQEALRALLAANVTGFTKVYADANETDIDFASMPLADVTVETMDLEVLAGQNYYVTIALKVSIYAADFTSFKNSCTLRNSLLKSAQDAVRINHAFHSEIETSRLGKVTFAKASDEENGAFVALAEMDVYCMGYRDR